ncbi:hypothetical protein CPB83DRAFT_843394 [Crepidotus variabilis]|uniref:Uncharacterized protein n=1 Tax=Crepidotus variabilis TaxID=179855 RepID=A0A9P6JWF5_9AGAR|nr:hypothetical protein CPB83DRAFT_843394 [Crepidotus variabilis]
MSLRRPHQEPQPFQAQPTSPELLKKVETSIIREAKQEEKNLKHVVKDLGTTEKGVNKAHKSADKAETMLSKAEKNEHQTLKNLNRAENNHDRAVANVHSAQNDMQMRTREFTKAQQVLESKKAQVEAAIKDHDNHTAQRNAKLAALRGPESNNEAAKVVAEATGARASAAGPTVA